MGADLSAPYLADLPALIPVLDYVDRPAPAGSGRLRRARQRRHRLASAGSGRLRPDPARRPAAGSGRVRHVVALQQKGERNDAR